MVIRRVGPQDVIDLRHVGRLAPGCRVKRPFSRGTTKHRGITARMRGSGCWGVSRCT